MQKRMDRERASADPRRFLPLRPAAFAVLAALAEGSRPGIDILDSVNRTVPGRGLFGPGTLYRLMRDLRADGLIERTARHASADDERQAFHGLTTLGRAVLRAEADRLRRTLALVPGAAARSER